MKSWGPLVIHGLISKVMVMSFVIPGGSMIMIDHIALTLNMI